MKQLSAVLSGLLFGLGLLVSGMSNPAKVLSFLDIAGTWDPSLLLVMGAAVLVGSLLFPLALRKQHTVFGEPLHVPRTNRIDRRLIVGSLLFGIGWGIAGFCPGPALVDISLGGKPLLFCGAMLFGMACHSRLVR